MHWCDSVSSSSCLSLLSSSKLTIFVLVSLQRLPKSELKEQFPHFIYPPTEDMPEADEMFDELVHESPEHVQERVRHVLEHVWTETGKDEECEFDFRSVSIVDASRTKLTFFPRFSFFRHLVDISLWLHESCLHW